MSAKIGILGGMTPESTVTYYTTIIHSYEKLYGDYAFPEILICSVSFQQFIDWMHNDDWDSIRTALGRGLNQLEKAGADFAVIATNTMHLLFSDLAESVSLPLLSIVDAVAGEITSKGLKKTALLGTKFTMSKGFYAQGLLRHGIETIIPDQHDQEEIHSIIFSELGKGIITEKSRDVYLTIIDKLAARGAEGIILGCTEIPLLIRAKDSSLPLFDTAEIHARAALLRAMEGFPAHKDISE